MTIYPLTGGCLCGRVRYRIDATPRSTSLCHCRTCRRAAGAQSVAWAFVARTAFAWTEGDAAGYESSPGITRGFCGACGTTLTYDDGSDTVDVTLASLDDPEALPPARETWHEHRLSWSPTDPALPHVPRSGGRAA